MSYQGISFPVFGPTWSVQFLGVMVSLDGCAVRAYEPHIDGHGNLLTGQMRAHAGVTASVTWGVQIKWFTVGIVTTGEFFLDLDPNRDGKVANPASIFIGMFKQSCTETKNRDWKVLLYQRWN